MRKWIRFILHYYNNLFFKNILHICKKYTLTCNRCSHYNSAKTETMKVTVPNPMVKKTIPYPLTSRRRIRPVHRQHRFVVVAAVGDAVAVVDWGSSCTRAATQTGGCWGCSFLRRPFWRRGSFLCTPPP